MPENQKPRSPEPDSSVIIQEVLDQDFRLREASLDGAQLIAAIVGLIKEFGMDDVTVVSLVGGAASGKSTLAQELVATMREQDIPADAICTDDFNREDRAWRWANFEGDNPQPPIGKYDFAYMNSKIEAIRQNKDAHKTIAVPTYDEHTGLAIAAGEENYTHHIGPVQVLFVEGDFHPVQNPDLVIYLHVPDNTRLQSRIARDARKRGFAEPEKTAASFALRHHNQHVPYTVPVASSADYIINADTSREQRVYDIYERL